MNNNYLDLLPIIPRKTFPVLWIPTANTMKSGNSAHTLSSLNSGLLTSLEKDNLSTETYHP